MKKLFSLVCAILISISNLNAQNASNLLKQLINDGNGYFEVVNKLDSIVNLDSTLITNGGYKEYLRWKAFWGDRIGYFEKTQEGDYRYALEAMHKYALTPRCSSPDNLTSNWELIGPVQEPVLGEQHLGIINSIYMDPNDNNFVLAGSMWGGIFLSTNAMDPNPIWKNIMMDTKLPQIGISSIVVNPNNHNEVWASLGWQYGLGVIYCSDISVANPQWELIGPEIFPLDEGVISADKSVIYKIIIHPNFNTTPILYAITGEEVYRITKTNNGTFTSNIEGFSLLYPNSLLRDVEFDPSDPNGENIIVSGKGIWRLDYFNIGGWEQIFNPNTPIGNAKVAVDGNNIYAFYLSVPNGNNFSQQNIAKYVSGQNWNLIYNQLNSLNTNTPIVYSGTPVFEVNENNGTPIFYAEGGRGNEGDFKRKVVRSIGGTNWTIQSEYSSHFNGTFTHADIRASQLVAKSIGGASDKLVIGNDGGILFTNLTGTLIEWQNINGTGLATNLFNGIDVSETGGLLTAGAQDNGFFRNINNTWSRRDLGDGGKTEINDNCEINECYSYNTMDRDIDRFPNILNSLGVNSTSPVSEAARFERPIYFDNLRNILYAGFHNLYFYSPTVCNQTTSLTLLGSYNFTTNNNIPSGDKMSGITVSPSDPNIIYVSYEGYNYGAFNGTRLFMSNDGGQSFSDISMNLNPIDYWSINEIAIDERNPYHIWIGFNGIGYDKAGFDYDGDGIDNESISRIIEGNFDGTNWIWEDVSDGLPEFPINCLIYENGTKGALYAGTDNGVFYRNENMDQWECFNNNLPLGMVTDLKINYCENKIYASVYGNAIWKSPLANSPSQEYEISGNIEWYGNKTINKDVIISDGSSLKIYQNGILDTKIKFTENAGIIVKPGGKLEIENATLTSACGTWWEGVQAVGYELSPQTLAAQPFIKLNNATIENAYVAIRGGTPDLNIPDQTIPYNGGAIVQVNNSTFRNNWIDIQFMPFHRMVVLNNIEYELRNLSFVKNSHFITDADLTIPGHIDPLAHIQMTDINGIVFRNNIFESTRTGITKDKAGVGIMALDAKFDVLANCTVPVIVGGLCPTPNLDGNEFRNLFAGIYTGIGTGYSNIKVYGNLFEDCVYGMYLGGVNYNKITYNTFKIPQADDSFTDPITGFTYKASYGIYMQSTFGSNIEENIFENSNNGGSNRNLGIYSENGGVISGNKVYRNDFTNLTYGTQSVDDNQLLDIDCNRFYKYANTFADIHHASGTLKDQGFCHFSDFEQPQANEFYGSTCDNSGNLQIHKNPIAATFEYNSYNQTSVFLDIINCVNSNINAFYCPLQPYNRNDACPPTLTTSGIAKIPFLRSVITLERNSITQLKSQIDGGNTESLINAINSNMISGQLKNLLMQYSPYLSDKVLISAINRANPMSPAHLKQILLDNSPLTEAVLYNLNKNPLSIGHMNQILDAQTGESARSELDDEIRYHDAEKLYAMNELVGIYLDTNWIDSALVTLQNDGSVEAMCLLLPLASKKDTILVSNHIEMIRNFAAEEELWYPLNQTVKELQAFCDFHESLYNIKNRSGSYFSLKQEERDRLEFISQSLTSVKIYARSVLDFTQNIQKYFGDHDFIYNNGSTRLVLLEEYSQELFKIYPNPFEDNFTAEFNLNDEPYDAYILITDIAGKTIKSIPIVDDKSNISISINSNSGGIYLATLYNKGAPLKTIKLIGF